MTKGGQKGVFRQEREGSRENQPREEKGSRRKGWALVKDIKRFMHNEGEERETCRVIEAEAKVCNNVNMKSS